MGRDVIRPVALDLVLRIVLRSPVPMAFIIEIRMMNPDDPARHITGFGIPAHMIADRIFCQDACPVSRQADQPRQ